MNNTTNGLPPNPETRANRLSVRIPSPNEIPEWKRRQILKEQAQAQKVEIEAQRKLENLKNTPSPDTRSETLQIIEPISNKSQSSDSLIPEWKRRMIEKERGEAEKAEQEYLRRQEAIKNPTIDMTEQRQYVDASIISEKELLRLEKTINRYSVKK